MLTHHSCSILCAVLFSAVVTTSILARPVTKADHRVLPDGELPNDHRLGELRHLDGYFPFHVPDTREAWVKRRAALQLRIRVATGLWPTPTKTPLKAVIHGRVERKEFTVDKVYFQSYPGHFVTGLLFRPKGRVGRLPAVLSPHGHGGRLQDLGAKRIRRAIIEGSERFEGSGRYPKLARCAQLARMGCVTFIYDMIGYADSQQISREIAHKLRVERPKLDKKDRWGFFGTQAEARLQSIYGLQTWNSIRALDFLCDLPDVDPSRVAVTGGSGGGTQTIMVCALDPRPIAAFPQGMISTSMQGGCTCENTSLLRVNAGNVELTALFAPKPQGMTAANDWTREMMTKGYPELKKLYALLGAPDDVFCKSLVHFEHNYNYVTRALMYSWLNKHMKLGLVEPIVEEDFDPLTEEEWTIWNTDHPQPPGGPDHECALTKWMEEDSQKQLARLFPQDADALARYREVVGGAFRTIIGRDIQSVGRTAVEVTAATGEKGYTVRKLRVKALDHEEELPALFLRPSNWNQTVVVWIDQEGKSSLFAENGDVRAKIRTLLSGGSGILAADLVYQGEFLDGGDPPRQARFRPGRPYAGYTLGYNHALFAQRVHDVLTLVAFAGSHLNSKNVQLVGMNGAAAWVASATFLADGMVSRAAVDTSGFRFANVPHYRDPDFLPGAVKYGDFPALLALCAPTPLWISGEKGQLPDLTEAAYHASGRTAAVSSHAGLSGASGAAAVKWLLEKRMSANGAPGK